MSRVRVLLPLWVVAIVAVLVPPSVAAQAIGDGGLVAIAAGPGPTAGLVSAAAWQQRGAAMPVPATEPMSVAIALASRDPAGFAAAVNAVNEPTSPEFHHYLSARAVMARFGPDPSAVRALEAWLRTTGLKPEPWSGGTIIDVDGTAGAFSAALHVGLYIPDTAVLEQRQITLATAGSGSAALSRGSATRSDSANPQPSDAKGAAPTGEDATAAAQGRVVSGTPLVPKQFGGLIASIVGLQAAAGPLAVPQAEMPGAGPAGQSQTTSMSGAAGATEPVTPGPSGGYNPRQIAEAYDYSPLYALGYHGEHTRVAIVALAPYDQNDLAQYASWAGVGATVHDIPVDGGAQHLVSSVETTLDIELLSSAAPGTTVDVYQAPSDATDKGLIDAYGQVASAGNAQVLALTWDTCELAALQIPGLLMDEHTLFEQISLEGTTIVAATGDSGAYACQNVPSVNIPAADPDALAVGATDVTLWQPVRQTGWWSIYVESAWSNSSCTSLQMPQGEGTGGGTSIAFFTGDRYGDDLSWQATSSPGGNARRLPDVAISGGSGCDAHHMYPIYYRHSWTLRGGTSASAMEWAALILLTDQYLSAKNAAPLGWVNPMVYKIAEKQQPLPAFHDVFIGDNLRQGAGPGWDYSTGWGSPDGWNFAYDVCSALGYCTSGLNSGTPTRVASRTATSTPTRTPTRTPASAPSPIPTLTPARTSSAIVTAAATGTGNALPSATP